MPMRAAFGVPMWWCVKALLVAGKPDLARLADRAQHAGILPGWRVMLPTVRAGSDSDFDSDSGFDSGFGDDQRGGRWDSVFGVLRTVGGAIFFVAALAILYLAFRGPSSHPAAGTAPATASPHSPDATRAQGAGQGTGVRPGAVAPPVSLGASASQAAGPLGAQARAYLAGRLGRVEAAVYDLSTGRQWTLGQQVPQAESRVVSLEILEAVLHQRTSQRMVLSLTEQELTPRMIERSDDGAATALWGDAGRAKGMRAFDHDAGLAHTSPSECLRCPGFSWPGWELTTTTPRDQITLLRQLVRPSGVLDKNDQKYALYLLENVTPSQRWGVSGGVPAGVTLALANGWLPLGAGNSDWQVNSVGWASGDGRNYLMAVFSTGSPSEQYGIDTLSHLGAMVWTALAPHR
jgi:beta-lactamase family protein